MQFAELARGAREHRRGPTVLPVSRARAPRPQPTHHSSAFQVGPCSLGFSSSPRRVSRE